MTTSTSTISRRTTTCYTIFSCCIIWWSHIVVEKAKSNKYTLKVFHFKRYGLLPLILKVELWVVVGMVSTLQCYLFIYFLKTENAFFPKRRTRSSLIIFNVLNYKNLTCHLSFKTRFDIFEDDLVLLSSIYFVVTKHFSTQKLRHERQLSTSQYLA